jgi:hypothetical protein
MFLAINQVNFFHTCATFLCASRPVRSKVESKREKIKTNFHHTRKSNQYLHLQFKRVRAFVVNFVFRQLNGRVLMWKLATIKTSLFMRNCNQIFLIFETLKMIFFRSVEERENYFLLPTMTRETEI